MLDAETPRAREPNGQVGGCNVSVGRYKEHSAHRTVKQRLSKGRIDMKLYMYTDCAVINACFNRLTHYMHSAVLLL